jgi:hypothetical protein
MIVRARRQRPSTDPCAAPPVTPRDLELPVRRNPCVYKAGGRLRVAARKPSSTAHRLVEMRATPSIERALECAEEAVPIAVLVAAVEECGADAEHAARLIGRLIGSQMLVPEAEIAASGDEPSNQARLARESLPGARAAVRPAVAISAASSGRNAGAARVDVAAPEPIGVG